MNARMALSVVPLVLTSGCLEEQRYVIENEAVALTEDTPIAFVDEDDNEFYAVERRFELPISEPTEARMMRLFQDAVGMDLPFPRLPWVERRDLELTVDYVVANLANDPVVVNVTLDGENEFHAYRPGPEDFHQWERRIELGPRERVTGSISELEMDEIAIDLATVVNPGPDGELLNSNMVVHARSQSSRDERVRDHIPRVVPGLVALRFGLVSPQAQPLVLEVSVRAQDHGGRLCERGEERWELPEPMDFVPVVPEEP